MRTQLQPLRTALISKQSCINPYLLQHARTVHSGVNHRTPISAKYEARDHGYPNSTSSPTAAAASQQAIAEPPTGAGSSSSSRSESLLSRMPTSTLIRSLVLGTVFMSPRLTRVALPVMDKIANSQSALLSPSRNPVVKYLVKTLVYEHFCAGENKAEVALKRRAIREMGYSGVVLCCGQEIQITRDARLHSTITAGEQDEISQWREGSLQTVDMIGDGDWMGIKFTGAGTEVTQALMQNQPPPAAFRAAIYEVCERAAAKNCRIWIDSEQQVVQRAIDAWTIDLMRHFNRQQRPDGSGGGAVVYNTLQAYLKASRSKLKHQLSLARSEGWTLGLKLVRGAYMANDQRDLIHDTKAETDESYNGIVRDVLQGTNLGVEGPEEGGGKLGMQLLLAGHNPESVHGAMELVETLQAQGRLAVMPEFGQLQGMGDVLGCELLDRCEGFQAATAKNAEAGVGAGTTQAVPRVYKCLTWGSVQECIQYQLRRVIENSGASDRMRDGLSACAAELRRRVGRAVWPGW